MPSALPGQRRPGARPDADDAQLPAGPTLRSLGTGIFRSRRTRRLSLYDATVPQRPGRGQRRPGHPDATTSGSAHFGRFEPLPGNQPAPLALRYHGHQFRVYNPDLGDGRGFLFAQLREAGTGRLLDLGTKGSGQTPWSRTGDGRLTLKGGVREVLATEMLEALGVPTSRAFSLIETGEALMRGDEPSPTRSAVLMRLSHSHIRFGTFQRHAYLDRPRPDRRPRRPRDRGLLPGLGRAAGRPAMLDAVVERTAGLTARWMAAGFVHGVLNTDNMNVTGESFDYGPWRFLPRNDPDFTAAYFDHSGLYALRPPARGGVLEPAAAGRLPDPGRRRRHAGRGLNRFGPPIAAP